MVYFIDIEDEHGLTKDMEGGDFPNKIDAYIEPLSSLSQIISDRGVNLHGRRVSAYIRDPSGRIVYKAALTLSGCELANK